jgi:hypothetical protein
MIEKSRDIPNLPPRHAFQNDFAYEKLRITVVVNELPIQPLLQS